LCGRQEEWDGMKVLWVALVGLLVAVCACIHQPAVGIDSIEKSIATTGGYEENRIVIFNASGFFVSDEGYMFIAGHSAKRILKPGGSIVVYVNGRNNKSYSAKLIAIDKHHDLALIKTKKPLGHVVYKICNDVQAHEKVVVYAARNEITEVIVGKVIGQVEESSFHFVTSAPIDYGFSGGPVVSMNRGCVLGVTTNLWRDLKKSNSYFRHPKISPIILKALKQHAPESLELFK